MDVCLLDFLSVGAVYSAQPSFEVTTLIVSPQVWKSEGDTDIIDSWRHRLIREHLIFFCVWNIIFR